MEDMMQSGTQVLESVRANDGTEYQLLYTPGSGAAWVIVIDGRPDESFDDHGDAQRAWREVIAAAGAE
jgi:hypothetical protein